MSRSIGALAFAVTSLAAVTPSIHAQDISAVIKCADYKDSKKRLACYDSSVPSVLKEIAQIIASRISKESEVNAQKIAADENARSAQTKLMRESLRELRKLATAVDVGISKVDYSRRLVDVTASVRENLNEIEEGPIKVKLVEALSTYNAANEIWAATFEAEMPIVFFKAYGKIMREYGVTIDVYPKSEHYSKFMRIDRSLVIAPIWVSAAASLAEAETLVKLGPQKATSASSSKL